MFRAISQITKRNDGKESHPPLLIGGEGLIERLPRFSELLQAFYDSLDAKQKKAFDTGGRIGGIFDWWGKK